MVLLLLSLFAPTADAADVTVRASKVRGLIDTGNEDAARGKCEAWGATSAGADPRLRHVCAEVWLADAERVDTIESWSTFRKSWSDTSWADGAKKREAELTLDALGYDASEAEYLSVGDKFPGTPTASLAYERAAESALRAIKTPEEAVRVASKYPAQVPNLLRTHLDAFVQVSLGDDGKVNVRVDPTLIDPKTLSYTWVSRAPDGTVVPYVDALVAHVAAYGVPEDVARNAADRTDGPPFPACADPGTKDVWGLDVKAASGHTFVPVPAPQECAADVKTARVIVDGTKVSALAYGDRKVSISGSGSGAGTNGTGWSDVRSLVSSTGTPSIGGGRIELPAGGATIVLPLNGGAPWVVGRAMTKATPLAPALGVGDGAERPLAPIVAMLVGADGAAFGTPAGIPSFTGGKPSDASNVVLKSADLGAVKAAAAWAGLKSVTFTAAHGVDLDGDKTAEVVAEGTLDGKPVIAVLRSTSLWVWTSSSTTMPGTPTAFSSGGKTYVVWAGALLVPQGKSFILTAR